MKSILYSEILVLTKSYKDGGFCVAGIDLTNNEFIRLVSNSDGGPLSDTETESISPLTVISFWGIPFPLKNQIENVIIDNEKQISIIRQETISTVEKMFDEKIFHNTGLIYNDEPVLERDIMKNVTSSLSIALFTNMNISKNLQGKYRAKFSYENTQKNFSMTDPEYCNNDYYIHEGLMIISIPLLNNSWNMNNPDKPYFKFIAKIFDLSSLT